MKKKLGNKIYQSENLFVIILKSHLFFETCHVSLEIRKCFNIWDRKLYNFPMPSCIISWYICKFLNFQQVWLFISCCCYVNIQRHQFSWIYENHSFKETFCGQWSFWYKWLEYVLNFNEHHILLVKSTTKFLKNWYSTNIDKTTVCFYHSTALSTDRCPFCTASCPSSKLNPMDIKHTSMSSTLCKYTRHLHRLHIVANPPLHTPYME